MMFHELSVAYPHGEYMSTAHCTICDYWAVTELDMRQHLTRYHRVRTYLYRVFRRHIVFFRMRCVKVTPS